MTAPTTRPFAVAATEAPVEAWGPEPLVTWRTHTSADRTDSNDLTTGVCTIAAGGELGRHRHAQPEVYHYLSGAGRMQVNDEVFDVVAGTTVFVPGHAWHHTVNTGDEDLRLFYCFAADSFADIRYHYPDGSEWQATDQ